VGNLNRVEVCYGYKEEGSNKEESSTEEKGSNKEEGSTEEKGSSKEEGSTEEKGCSKEEGSTEEKGSSKEESSTEEKGSNKEEGGSEEKGSSKEEDNHQAPLAVSSSGTPRKFPGGTIKKPAFHSAGFFYAVSHLYGSASIEKQAIRCAS
jgi:hypothetical protein